jgi:hypothetical protein
MIVIPKGAKDNALLAMVANAQKNNKCATLIGKKRASQLLNQSHISLAIAKRTYSYLSRAKAYDTNDWSRCGTISYNLWGGDAMYNHLKKIFK